MVVVVAELVEEGPRLEDEGGEDDAGEVHPGADLLHLGRDSQEIKTS